MKVFLYNDQTLCELLCNEFTTKDSIIHKNHFQYLINYLGTRGLSAVTMVVEEKYINRDYFSDFASYYSFCFQNYSKFCKRIHFFNYNISVEDIERIILCKENNLEFDNSYLGFIVIKPLPYTVIGFSLLKLYPDNDPDCVRNYFGVRDYVVHFFGYKFKLSSLAFQEQDSVLSACATTAIWSTLQKAAEIDYQVIIKSPYEITKDAGLMALDGGRLFPNKNGLSMYQMCQAINASGLVVEVRHFPNSKSNYYKISNSYLKKIIFAYSQIGIPLILVVDVPSNNNRGLHAIAINGYSYKKEMCSASKPEISWKADDIDKIYGHDDQWGPFAKITFDGHENLITDWSKPNYTEFTYTYGILIPVFPKIRISYDDIEAISVAIDEMLSFMFYDLVELDFYWDIRVFFSEMYKHNVRISDLPDEIKIKILTTSLPKYLWISSCYVGDEKLFDFIFDATDLANSMFMISIISYDSNISELFKKFLIKNPKLVDVIKHPCKDMFYNFIVKNC